MLAQRPQITCARRHLIWLGSLPRALAAKLDVKFKAPVDALRVDGQGIEVRTAGESIRADQVILATTASVARTLVEFGIAAHWS